MRYFLALLLAVMLSGCNAVIVSGGVLEGISIANSNTTFKDYAKNKATLASFNSRVLLSRYSALAFTTDAYVLNNNIYLLGNVTTDEAKSFLEDTAAHVRNIEKVVTEIDVVEKRSIWSASYHLIADSFATAQIKTRLIFMPKVKSPSFYIKTLNGRMYLISNANDYETEKVATYATRTFGIDKVIVYS